MEEFKCRFEIEGLPSTVRSGQILNISAQVLKQTRRSNNRRICAGRKHLQPHEKVSDNKFSLS